MIATQGDTTVSVVFISIASAPGPRSAGLGAASVLSYIKAEPKLAARCSLHLVEASDSESAESILKRAQAFSPSVIGLSVYSWNRARMQELSGLARLALPEVLIVAGGPEAGSEEDSSIVALADIAVSGEGESAMRAILEAIVAGSAPTLGVMRTELLDAATLPSPWLDGTLDPKNYGGAVWEMARGCPYRCAFCYESRGAGVKIRPLALKRLEAELKLFAASGIDEVFVLDPTFNANEERMLSLLSLMEKHGDGMQFQLELRGELISEKQARALSRLNCSAQIGLQSCDPAVLELVDRKFDPKLFIQKAGILERNGIIYGFDLIYGLPGDTLAGFMASIDYALRLGPNHVDIFRLAVLPGTALAEKAESLGMRYGARAPHLVESTPKFGAQEMLTAEALAAAAEIFYNSGRAVMWFRSACLALNSSPSALIRQFADYLSRSGYSRPAVPAEAGEAPASIKKIPSRHEDIEALQLSFLEERFRAGGGVGAKPIKPVLRDATLEMVRCCGAWTRALADDRPTSLELHWEPEELLDFAAADIKQFALEFEPADKPMPWLCSPKKNGPAFKPGRE